MTFFVKVKKNLESDKFHRTVEKRCTDWSNKETKCDFHEKIVTTKRMLTQIKRKHVAADDCMLCEQNHVVNNRTLFVGPFFLVIHFF